MSMLGVIVNKPKQGILEREALKIKSSGKSPLKIPWYFI